MHACAYDGLNLPVSGHTVLFWNALDDYFALNENKEKNAIYFLSKNETRSLFSWSFPTVKVTWYSTLCIRIPAIN